MRVTAAAQYLRSAISVAFVVCALLSGCGPRVPTPEPTGAPETSSSPAETQTAPAQQTADIRVYLVRGESLGVAGREVPAQAGLDAQVAEALNGLLAAPTEADTAFGLGTTIPQGTELLGARVDNGVATVDLTRRFESGGGSLSMLLRVAQVVYTATQFEDVDRVAFELDGEPVEAIGGEGVTVSPPVGRDDFEGQLPPIFVESPVPGEGVRSPVPLSGSANVFEAQFNAKISNGMGDTLTETAVKAESGTGTRGAFGAEVPFDVAGPGLEKGVVTVFDLSEKDGSVIDRIDIPVLLQP